LQEYNRDIKYLFRATNRKGSVLVLNEFEEKLSFFYGAKIKVTTLAMDTWLCSNIKEIDNVVILLEPGEKE